MKEGKEEEERRRPRIVSALDQLEASVKSFQNEVVCFRVVKADFLKAVREAVAKG